MILLITIFFIFIMAYSLFFLWIMVYAWEDPEQIENNQAPKAWKKPRHSFTAIVAARFEERVIAETIRSISLIDYPKELKEIIVVCKSDDFQTIRIAQDAIYNLNNPNLKLVTFSGNIISKPHALNIGLKHASGDVVVIFDAEDEPHKDIYSIANTTFLEGEADVLQSGIQLMNFKTTWFSILNVLEYFFWFKSALHYFSKSSFAPLGGNTLFIKKHWLRQVGGWDAQSLTEDADIGVRLSLAGAKIKIVYDGKYATQEETPHGISSFIKQRSRWNQGFVQILLKGDWLKLPKFSQRLLAWYIFSWPFVQVLFFLFIPLSLWMNFAMKLPELVTLLSYAPLYIYLLIQITLCIGLYEFSKEYNKKLSGLDFIKVFLFSLPYQLLLGVSAFRGIYRAFTSNKNWEKTLHLNAHREVAPAIN